MDPTIMYGMSFVFREQKGYDYVEVRANLTQFPGIVGQRDLTSTLPWGVCTANETVWLKASTLYMVETVWAPTHGPCVVLAVSTLLTRSRKLGGFNGVFEFTVEHGGVVEFTVDRGVGHKTMATTAADERVGLVDFTSTPGAVRL